MKKTADNTNNWAVKKALIAVIIVISAIVLLGVILLAPTLRANRILDNIVEHTAPENSITQILITDLNSTSEHFGKDAKETLITDKAQVSALVSRLHDTAKRLEAEIVVASSLSAWGIRLRMYPEEGKAYELILTENGAIIVDGERMYSYTLGDGASLDSYAQLYEDISDMLE